MQAAVSLRKALPESRIIYDRQCVGSPEEGWKQDVSSWSEKVKMSKADKLLPKKTERWIENGTY